jgi:hypothetical protein
LPFRPRTCAQSPFTTSGLEARSGFGVIIIIGLCGGSYQGAR